MVEAATRRKFLMIALKIAVTLALFWLIARKLDFSDVVARLQSAALLGIAGSIILIFIQLALNSERWRRLQRLDGVTMPYGKSYRFYLEAMFFNQALPGAVGGDVMRIYRARSYSSGLGQAVTGVVLDRITGLIGLALLIAIGLPLLMQRTTENSAVLGFALVLAAFGAGLLAVFGIARLSETGFGGAGRVFIIRLSRLLARLLRHPGEAMTIFPLAVATHILMVLIAYVSADALRLDFSLLDCLIVVPASILIATLPISLGGWGVREGAMAAGFGLIGADAGGAVALSIVMGLQLVLVGLAGGAVWFFGDAARPDTDSLTLAKEGD